jgi:tetratricopeptide (TPR) repeat protein
LRFAFVIGLLALSLPAAEEQKKNQWIGVDELFTPALTSAGRGTLLGQQRVCFLRLHRRPDDMANLADIAEVQLKLGRHALAADYAQRLIQRDPTQVRAFRIFVQALYFSEKYSLVTALIDRAIKLGFDDPINRLLLVEMLVRAGDPERASVQLVRVLGELDEERTGLSERKLAPIKLHCLKNQAELYRHLGRVPEREACLDLIAQHLKAE